MKYNSENVLVERELKDIQNVWAIEIEIIVVIRSECC